jgi:hypothetical protein
MAEPSLRGDQKVGREQEGGGAENTAVLVQGEGERLAPEIGGRAVDLKNNGLRQQHQRLPERHFMEEAGAGLVLGAAQIALEG